MNNDKLSLDFFRNNDLACSEFRIKKNDSIITVPFVYCDFFNKVSLDFLNCIRRLENTKISPSAYNQEYLFVFTDFFACMEQFISVIYTLIYFYKINFSIPDEKKALKIFRKDYKDTIFELCSAISLSKKEYYKTGLSGKIAELEDARNYILHGNFGRIKTKNTKITKYPLTINCEDIMEEINIIINFINYFRFIFNGLDLMPHVSLFINDAIIFKKIDSFFYKFLCPYFKNVLNKHNLKATRDYNLSTIPLKSIENPIVERIDVLTKVKEEKKYCIKMNVEDTNLYVSELLGFFTEKEIRESQGNIKLPNYYR